MLKNTITEVTESVSNWHPVVYSVINTNSTTLQCVMGDKHQRFLKALHHATQT